jgi:chromosome segregation ATPase
VALDRADEELARLRRMLPELRQALETARADVQARDTTIARFHAEAERLRAELGDRTAQADALERSMDEIRRSTSWRVTRPLRALAGWWNRPETKLSR